MDKLEKDRYTKRTMKVESSVAAKISTLYKKYYKFDMQVFQQSALFNKLLLYSSRCRLGKLPHLDF